MVLLLEDTFGHGLLPGSATLSSGLPSASKFERSFRPESLVDMLGTVFLPWKEKFENGSPSGSAILSSVLPSTSNFGHIFRSESVLGISWVLWFLIGMRNLVMAHALGRLFCTLVCPLFQNLGIASNLSIWKRCWVMWFCLGSISLVMAHSLSQLFCPLDFPPHLNLGIASALSLWGRSWGLWFFLGR